MFIACALALGLATAPGLAQAGPEVESVAPPGSDDKPAPEAQLPASVRVIGTHVRLVPPPGFVTGRGFAGFLTADGSAALVVNELPGSAAEVSAGFGDPAALRAQGLELLTRREVMLGPDRGQLFRLNQRVPGADPKQPPRVEPRWMLVLGDADVTLTVLSRWSAEQPEFEGVLEAALLSTRWDRSPIDPFEGLDFELLPAAGAPFAGRLKLAQRMSELLIFTGDGRLQRDSEGAPFLTFGATEAPQQPAADAAERRAFANRLLASAGEIGSLNVKRARAFEVDGRIALEQVATAKGLRSGLPLAVYQLVIFGEERCYQGVGVVGREAQDVYLPAFHDWCVGFRRRPAGEPGPVAESLETGDAPRAR